jgi:GTP cyclohydrolase IV
MDHGGHEISLSQVGLANVEKVIPIGLDGRFPQLVSARLDCFVELGAAQRYARTSGFQEAIHEALRAVDGTGLRAEELAAALAERVRERQRARQVEVAIVARFPERRAAPVSRVPSQEISTLHARAVASERGIRCILGVSAQGMTTSPRTQAVLAARARERLAAGGFSHARIARVLQHVPVATDSRLGMGTLHLGLPGGAAPEVGDLLAIVEEAMSSDIFELLKRGDEAAVVERAHRRPRSAADSVQAMIAGVVERFADLPDDAFAAAAHENLETIHRHAVSAERTGTLGELRREPAAARHTSMRAWLMG